MYLHIKNIYKTIPYLNPIMKKRTKKKLAKAAKKSSWGMLKGIGKVFYFFIYVNILGKALNLLLTNFTALLVTIPKLLKKEKPRQLSISINIELLLNIKNLKNLKLKKDRYTNLKTFCLLTRVRLA